MNNLETFFVVVGVLNIAGIIVLLVNLLLLKFVDSFRDYFHKELSKPDVWVYVFAFILFPITLTLFFAELIEKDSIKWKEQKKNIIERELKRWNKDKVY